jgi:cysteine protease ATG4
VSLFSRLKNLATNLNYSLSNSTQKSTGSSVATLLGTKINSNVEAEVKARITKILWFSYRDKISPIMEDVFHKSSYTCDRGWGCMLRAGQMMLGQAIKSHLNYSFESETDAEDEKYNIISLFADTIYEGYISPFSIHQISRKAYEYFGLKPGEWYKPSNIMVTLSKVKDQFDPLNLQNLKICICLDGTVFEDQIAERVFNNKPVVTNGTQEKKNDGNSDESDFNPEVLLNNQWDNSLLLFIATKTGLDEHNPLYLNTITKLMSFKESIGMLGGKGSRAFYFIGLQNNDLLYFDPHYVQDAASDLESLKQASNTYFLNKCFQINIKDIDTSVGFGFYIRDQNEYKNFRTTLSNAIKQDPNFLVGLENVTPTLDLSPDDVIECKEDGSFEVIE